MPNSRRRRFAVPHNISQCKVQNGSQSSSQDHDLKSKTLPQPNTSKSKNKISPNCSKNQSSLVPVVHETTSENSNFSFSSSIHQASIDKDVTANFSNNDLQATLSALDDSSSETGDIKTSIPAEQEFPNDIFMSTEAETTAKREPRLVRRDKYPHQHRAKIRSPKRRLVGIRPENVKWVQEICTKETVGVDPIDWCQELGETIDHSNVASREVRNEERISCHSFDDMCRICHGGEALSPDLGQMISACACRGTVGRVHVKCLERWLTESGKSRCELCGTLYATRRVHRYGLPKALVMWMLSQNAKQLMVDSLGIMLMSPLAVLAAWLSGRTLAGLMTPDSQAAPWPLASTFVLACMTLVCYYCWIVSAATRHALGWWIWYRSQYEVRLQFQEEEE